MNLEAKQKFNFLPEHKAGHIIVMVGLLVLGMIIGAVVSGLYYKGKTKQAETACAKQAADLKNSASAGIPGALNLPKIPVPAEVTSINGTVSKIDGNTLTVDAFFFGDQKTFKVTVSDNTKIVKREIVPPPAKPADANAAPSSPFKDTDTKLSDIRENDSVMIDSLGNIKDKTEFEAKDIYIQIMNLPAVPAPATGNNTAPPVVPAK